MKPLFIPLKRKFFLAFEDGTKVDEWRIHGPRWNVKTCPDGRPVVLSLGYGKSRRLTGTISFTTIVKRPSDLVQGWAECYPDKPEAEAIRIRIKMDPPAAKPTLAAQIQWKLSPV